MCNSGFKLTLTTTECHHSDAVLEACHRRVLSMQFSITHDDAPSHLPELALIMYGSLHASDDSCISPGMPLLDV